MKVFCMYCGHKLTELDISVAAKAHVQKLEITGVCEFCNKPSIAVYGVQDIQQLAELDTSASTIVGPMAGSTTTISLTCSACGGSMIQRGGLWHCNACEAIGQ